MAAAGGQKLDAEATLADAASSDLAKAKRALQRMKPPPEGGSSRDNVAKYLFLRRVKGDDARIDAALINGVWVG